MPPSFLSFCHQTDLTNRFNNPIGFLLTLNWGRNDSHTSFQRPSLCRHCRVLRPKNSAFSPGRWGAIAHSKKSACCPWRSRCLAVRRVESRDVPIQILVLMVRPPTCSTQFVLVVTSTVCARLGGGAVCKCWLSGIRLQSPFYDHHAELKTRFDNPFGFLPSLHWDRNDPHANFQHPGIGRHCRILRPKRPGFPLGRCDGAMTRSSEFACCPWRPRRPVVRCVFSQFAISIASHSNQRPRHRSACLGIRSV